MTSLSRKKLRTTVRSTSRPTDIAATRVAVAVALAMLTVFPASADQWRSLDRHPIAAEQAQPAFEHVQDGRKEGDAIDLVSVDTGAEGDATEADDDKSDSSACGAASKDCREALQFLRDDRLANIGLDIRVSGRAGNDYPCECRLEGETFEPRRFAATMFTWKAAGYCHKPLYFEDWNLERYGHSRGWLADPFVSAAHFFVTLPVLPYKMGVELPWECVYPLGYYRPGNCAPWTCPAVPISVRGMAIEAATVTGIVFLLP
ncbi:MAG: hypothetical protein WCQ91_04435 [Planctomycetota bacterium]